MRASSEQRFEIIVVDDGSDDADWQALQALADLRTKVMQRTDGTKGPSRCRNLGLAEAQGEYVIFLDSDDLLAAWCIEERLKAARQDPAADLWVFPVLLFKETPGDMDLLWNAMTDGRDPAERFACSDPPWHTSSPLWKREALQRLGGFNEAVFYGDDSDLHLRALVDGLDARLYPDALPDAFVRRSEAPRITNSLSSALIESRRIRLREGTRFLAVILPNGGRRHPVGCVRHPAEHSSPQPCAGVSIPKQPPISTPAPVRLLALWEGQYFVEAEFLLFNHAQCGEAIRQVLADWERDFSPAIARRLLVRVYFAVALWCRHRAYLMLRIARRVAMKLLPAAYFPRGGQYHAAHLDGTMMATLLERLGASPKAPRPRAVS